MGAVRFKDIKMFVEPQSTVNYCCRPIYKYLRRSEKYQSFSCYYDNGN
jgi:hypothetical protein